MQLQGVFNRADGKTAAAVYALFIDVGKQKSLIVISHADGLAGAYVVTSATSRAFIMGNFCDGAGHDDLLVKADSDSLKLNIATWQIFFL